jgi:hypothetical protein
VSRRATHPNLLVFASGSNHAGEIEGFGSIGQHVGVAAPNVNTAAERALLALPAHIHVFVDSGAFSEVEFTARGPVVVDPITDWPRRLALYTRLAGLGHRLHVVAPDQVGNQEETLLRMRRYSGEMWALYKRGVEVLVPLQRGALSLLDFEREAARALGFWGTPAIPMKKHATSVESLAPWLTARQPARVHLLGLGERNPDIDRILALFAELSPATVISLDANKITASVGRSPTRPLTAATDTVDAAMEHWGDAYEESIGQPSSWLSSAGLRRVGETAGLQGAALKAWVKDPEDVLSSAPDELAALQHELDTAWRAYSSRHQTTERKRRAVRLAFGSELREVTASTITATLHKAALEGMMKKTSRLYIVAELLDDPGFYADVERTVARALGR